jgi:hypothetical protein
MPFMMFPVMTFVVMTASLFTSTASSLRSTASDMFLEVLYHGSQPFSQPLQLPNAAREGRHKISPFGLCNQNNYSRISADYSV